jgi:hypothetical protein
VNDVHRREGTSTRRKALFTALSGSIGGFMWKDAATKKGKKRKKRRNERCPSTCPVRVACACSDGSCTYLPFNGSSDEVREACANLCDGTSGFEALISGPGYAAACTLFGMAVPVACTLL